MSPGNSLRIFAVSASGADLGRRTNPLRGIGVGFDDRVEVRLPRLD
jgi:hypothetical protein